MRLQTWKPQKLKEKLIGNHKETQNTLKISGLFHFTRLVGAVVFILFSHFKIRGLTNSLDLTKEILREGQKGYPVRAAP